MNLKALMLSAATLLFSTYVQAAMLDPSGDAVLSSDVASLEVGLDGNKSAPEEEFDAVYDAHPGIARDVLALRAITRIVATTSGTFDFYMGDDIVMILGLDNQALYVRETAVPFFPAAISYSMTETQAQTGWMSQVTFVFKGCSKIVQPQPEEVENCSDIDVVLNLEKIEQPL